MTNFLSSWDERLKVLSFFLMIIALSLSNHAAMLLFLVLFVLALHQLAGLNFQNTLKQIYWPIVLVFFFLPLFALTSGGDILFKWGPVAFYQSGISLGIRIFLRSISLLVIVIVFFQTSDERRIFSAAGKLGMPGVLVNIFLFTLRYIQLYSRDLRQLFIAARLRGGKGKHHPFSLSVSFSILVTLLIRSFEQSERTYFAMRLRGYNQEFRSVDSFKTKLGDIVKFVITLGFAVVVIFLDRIILK